MDQAEPQDQSLLRHQREPGENPPAPPSAIRHVASIKFDGNAVITTDQVDPAKQALVTLDRNPPGRGIGVLPGEIGTAASEVSWSGTDVGSGIAGYEIYVSTDGGAWELWRSFPHDVTSAAYQAQIGHSYGFYSIARD